MEERQRAELEAQKAPQPITSSTRSVKPLKKSRFRPSGSFIIFQPPQPEDELPEFAITIPFELRGTFVVTVAAHASAGGVAGTFEQVVSYIPPSPIPEMHAYGSFSARVAMV